MSAIEISVSATEPQAVEVCTRPGGMVSDVWLRKGIRQDTAEQEGGEAVEFWTSEEVHLVVQGVPEPSEIEASFDSWWQDATYEPPTVAEKLDEQDARLTVIEDALMEVADLIG